MEVENITYFVWFQILALSVFTLSSLVFLLSKYVSREIWVSEAGDVIALGLYHTMLSMLQFCCAIKYHSMWHVDVGHCLGAKSMSRN